MKWTRMLASALLLTVWGVSPAVAIPVHFSDNAIHWPNWGNSTGDDSSDVIGAPNFTGGVVEVTSGGRLSSITVNQNSLSTNYSMLAPGDLFIDWNADQRWDYFVDLTSWTTPGAGNANAPAGSYTLWSIDLRLGGSNDNPGYILSGSDNSGGWSGYNIRDGHPVAVGDSVARTDTGMSVLFSGWNDSHTESFSFTFLDPGILLGAQFTIGWSANCANDVIYATMNNPVPEPATMLLLGSGLVGLAGFRKRLRKKS